MAITSLLAGLLAVVGVARHTTLDAFLLAELLPFLPVLVIGVRQFIEQRQAASRFSGALSEQELTHRSSRFAG